MLPGGDEGAIAIQRMVIDGDTVILEAAGTAMSAACPGCGRCSHRVHDRSVRRLLDLPWRGATVRLRLVTRRFVCGASGCARRTFSEPFGDAAPRSARRSAAVSTYLLQLAQLGGAEAGARVATRHGVPVSPDTLLRLQRRGGVAACPTPRVLGVDDFSIRRGRTYGTLLVDLETHAPVDVVEGRDAQTLANWLAAHPGVEVVVRDRAGAYAEGAQQGAPDAQQIADRFHLVKNASDALDLVLRGRPVPLPEASGAPPAPDDTPMAVAERADTPEVAAAPPPTVTDELAAPALPPKVSKREAEGAARRAERFERWRRVHALHDQGHRICGIAREVGLDRKTVTRLLGSEAPPRNRIVQPRPSGLSSPTLQPFVAYLQDRWQAGCHNICQLHRELVVLGYSGSRSLVLQSLKAWRPPTSARAEAGPVTKQERRRLCLRPPGALKPDEQATLAHILAADPVLATGHTLVQRFREVVRQGDVAGLERWLRDAQQSGLPSFRSLAAGIVADRRAVEAALTSPYSNGQLEGQVCRAKLRKRVGYGRAAFDLLRLRILAA